MRIASLVSVPIVALLLGISTWSDPTTLEAATAPPANVPSYKIVRADYIDLSGNRPHTNTTCHVINRSVYAITLTNAYVLGPGGIDDIIAVHFGVAGTVVPPLGRLDVGINEAIPGVTPQTEDGQYGVRSVVFGWIGGPKEAVKLSATIERHATGDQDKRTHIQVEGCDIVL